MSEVAIEWSVHRWVFMLEKTQRSGLIEREKNEIIVTGELRRE